jgi:hypothetical protein
MANLVSQTLAADGSTAVVDWGGGSSAGYYLASGATFGSGTLSLQVSFDGGTTYVAAGSAYNLTAAGLVRFILPECKLRVTLSGATSPSIPIIIAQDSA